MQHVRGLMMSVQQSRSRSRSRSSSSSSSSSSKEQQQILWPFCHHLPHVTCFGRGGRTSSSCARLQPPGSGRTA